MSILLPVLLDARVLDLFAGSGALGLEALSRGARAADFVESGDRAVRTLKENIEALGASDRCVIHRMDAVRFAAALQESAFDVAFVDPPYSSGHGAAIVDLWQAVPFAAVLSVEHSSRDKLPAGGDTRRYGDSAITFYRCK
jgi:16S rRNA (guanine966-N2)-methyltransferase